ncbi:MAG: N(5)-(carboxyethyl)ornithine synthase, partial [Myxococcota bacterium]|nr:N(5)-(carboxyethyl)ornithine synthase [Myxococcota bacterium]
MSDLLSVGVVGSSFKENEQRAPIHPEHLEQIPSRLRRAMYMEQGYGERFGFTDDQISPLVAGLLPRARLFEECDVILLPKPTGGDLGFLQEGQTLWGWPHCVQGPTITQAAIDKRLTLIAWESMHLWQGDTWQLHCFHLNNEIAGYCGVLHALQLSGLTGHYGPYRKAAVIGFGSVGRGAIHGLHALGYNDITLFTQRTGTTVRAPIPSVKHWQFQPTAQEGAETEVLMHDGSRTPMAEALGHFDLVINATLQDTDKPLLFVDEHELHHLRPGTLVIDVSCDERMGFSFARPTSFEQPTFPVGHVTYYAVDHSPSYLWNTATYAISEALLPHLETVMKGPSAWKGSPTIQRAIEIQDGRVLNQAILRFQEREDDYPYP